MLDCAQYFKILEENQINFFTGVPDSLLKNFCSYLMDNYDENSHVINANEGSAIALAAGYYMANRKLPLVYMQNSGIGNATNPLISLVDPDVYSVPMLLVIGWRGEPGQKDEPQHIKQGKITLSQLDSMGINYKIMPSDIEDARECLKNAVEVMIENHKPFALVVRKGTFAPYQKRTNTNLNEAVAIESDDFSSVIGEEALKREDAIKTVYGQLDSSSVFVSTTGKTSRELYEYTREIKSPTSREFLTVGSMGHASQIALGVAMSKKNQNVCCFDGDGAIIMHMGSLGIVGSLSPSNFIHILLNNGSHESVGGQPTVGFKLDFPLIAKACGYKTYQSVSTKQEIINQLEAIKSIQGPHFLEIKVKSGSRSDLGRPKSTPIENKNNFMEFLSHGK